MDLILKKCNHFNHQEKVKRQSRPQLSSSGFIFHSKTSRTTKMAISQGVYDMCNIVLSNQSSIRCISEVLGSRLVKMWADVIRVKISIFVAVPFLISDFAVAVATALSHSQMFLIRTTVFIVKLNSTTTIAEFKSCKKDF